MKKTHTHRAARTTEVCACGATRTGNGQWEYGKNPNAVALAAKAVAMSTPEQRQEVAAAGGASRWKGTTKAQRSEAMREVASRPRPGSRIEDRCECGRFSREYAEKHGHLCGKALAARLAQDATKKETVHGR